ncbi:MAG TPA: triphosphoribosyl-dephospho-CoA synthase [Fimbriiglobus sp.]
MTPRRVENHRDRLRDSTGLMIGVASVWEATARKVGNVHRKADFADTTYLDFVLSALAVSDAWGKDEADPTAVFGSSVGNAVDATRALVDRNTNLGIILAVRPLAAVRPVAEKRNPNFGGRYDLRAGVRTVLDRLTVTDARRVFDAIFSARPGGLGDAPEQDVKYEPTVPLLDAMKLAADRDMIARQYANGYADVFDFGVPAFLAAFKKFGRVEPAIVECHLAWMAEFPDSLIARKNGLPAAEDVQRRVKHVLSLGGLDTPEGRAAGVALDRHLRSDSNKLNPGTSADLVAACLYVALREGKITPNAPFAWDAEDWL